MRAAGCVLATVIALAGGGIAGASVPPDDPTLEPLLLTVNDLPPGWQPISTPPLQAEPADAAAPDDPCNVLAHQFDAAYSAPHAAAGFSSGGLNLLFDIVFRLAGNDAASSLVNTFIGDMARCPTVTGDNGMTTTTYTPVPFPALGDTTAAYKGTWQIGNFIVLFVIISTGDKVILLDETGGGDDTTLLESAARIAVDRASPARWSKSSAG